jgi:hypothetical protein
MDRVVSFVKALAALPAEQLILLVALGALALAGFAIYVVHSLAKEGRRK